MARLIDADALKEQVESHVVSMSVCLSMDEHYGKVTMREDCLEDIDNAPTVDAIPVEWLKTQLTDESYDELISRWQNGQEAQDQKRDYEAAVEMAEYCERYEPTYNADDGSM